MHVGVLALDYDGTIAEAGRIHSAVRDAIMEARTQGDALTASKKIRLDLCIRVLTLSNLVRNLG